MSEFAENPVLDKRAIPPEAALRLRKVMFLFVLVLALSVILTLSYVAGRSIDRANRAANVGTATAAVTTPLPARPLSQLPNEPNPREQPHTQPPETAPVASTPVASVADPSVVPLTNPAVAKSGAGPLPVAEPKREVSARPELKNEEPPKVQQRKAEEPNAETPATEPPRKAQAATSGFAPGLYLQVAASSKEGAAAIAKAAGKKGIDLSILPGPDENIFRVVAGPFSSAPDLAKARASLEAGGYRPFVRRF